jgi:type II secretory ATPase GspE/PulE/Tfp pilus assembly ATPase PilB-like protein
LKLSHPPRIAACSGDPSESPPAVEPGPLLDLLQKAISLDAQAVRLQPVPGGCDVFFVVEDTSRQVERLPRYLYQEILMRIKLLSGTASGAHLPHASRLEMDVGGCRRLFFPACFPLGQDERVVIKIHRDPPPSPGGPLPGLSRAVAGRMQKRIRQGRGLFIAGGSAGSGRSATLQALVRLLDGEPVLMLEDRVGPPIPGADRVYRDPNDPGMGLDRLLPHVLAQGYKALSVENVRWGHEMASLMGAAAAGLSVMGTTYSAGVLEMLGQMTRPGADAFSVAGLLGFLTYQKKIISPCACGGGGGCDSCQKPVFGATRMQFEILFPPPELRKIIRDGAPPEVIGKLAAESIVPGEG